VPPPPAMGDRYQFFFTSVRNPALKVLSLSEVLLFDEHGEQVAVQQAHNPGGIPGNFLETPQSAIDGSTANKWLDMNFDGEARLVLDIASPRHIAQYELFTAKGRHRGRDPTSWAFGILWRGAGDEAGSDMFDSLSVVSGVDPPISESTSYGRYCTVCTHWSGTFYAHNYYQCVCGTQGKA
jgi:hypothetical protein